MLDLFVAVPAAALSLTDPGFLFETRMYKTMWDRFWNSFFKVGPLLLTEKDDDFNKDDPPSGPPLNVLRSGSF
ncbi:hypothetical protein VNO80_30616 [Phaseolus coccineus]|uniref:Uncharacterized protein n=1 Tax=Phaseolus coccineus TaxID=3886 RepID=A0AAN9LD39_PHACN